MKTLFCLLLAFSTRSAAVPIYATVPHKVLVEDPPVNEPVGPPEHPTQPSKNVRRARYNIDIKYKFVPAPSTAVAPALAPAKCLGCATGNPPRVQATKSPVNQLLPSPTQAPALQHPPTAAPTNAPTKVNDVATTNAPVSAAPVVASINTPTNAPPQPNKPPTRKCFIVRGAPACVCGLEDRVRGNCKLSNLIAVPSATGCLCFQET
jgi:hypothetical protein